MKHFISKAFLLSIFLSSLILFSGFVLAQSGLQQWTVASSTITFKIKNAGFTVDGSFKDMNASIVFDDANLAASSINATVNTKSINTGNGTRDGHLKGEKYFDIEKFPDIELKSNSFSKQANGRYVGNFMLAMKGIAKNVTIPFTHTVLEKTSKFSGSFTINRIEFGVGSSSMILSDKVVILLEVNTTKK